MADDARRNCYLWISWLVIRHSAHAAAVIAADNMTALDVITFYGFLGAYSKAVSVLYTYRYCAICFAPLIIKLVFVF